MIRCIRGVANSGGVKGNTIIFLCNLGHDMDLIEKKWNSKGTALLAIAIKKSAGRFTQGDTQLSEIFVAFCVYTGDNHFFVLYCHFTLPIHKKHLRHLCKKLKQIKKNDVRFITMEIDQRFISFQIISVLFAFN